MRLWNALVPADGGQISLHGYNHVLVAASSATALTFLLPSTTGAEIGDSVTVTNTLGGAITLRNPGNTATISVVPAGKIYTFRLSGDGNWFPSRETNHGTVTQLTSLTTQVTLNTKSGLITTVSATTGPGGRFEFLVNNSLISTKSMVTAVMKDYAGGGLPVARVGRTGSGIFTVHVENKHDSNDLDDTLLIAFDSWDMY